MDTGSRKFGIALTVASGLLVAEEYVLAVAVFFGYTIANIVLKLYNREPEAAE